MPGVRGGGAVTAAERATCVAVAATLRQVAWAAGSDGEWFHEVADEVERGDVVEWICCPLCQEVMCDGGCPLAVLRAGVVYEPPPKPIEPCRLTVEGARLLADATHRRLADRADRMNRPRFCGMCGEPEHELVVFPALGFELRLCPMLGRDDWFVGDDASVDDPELAVFPPSSRAAS